MWWSLPLFKFVNFHDKFSVLSGMVFPAAAHAGELWCQAAQMSAAAVSSTLPSPPRLLFPVRQEQQLATAAGQLSHEAQATGCRGREGPQGLPQLARAPAGRGVPTSFFTVGWRDRKEGVESTGVCVA